MYKKLLFIGLFFLISLYSFSEVFHVPSEFSSIQSAIDAASVNDTIIIDEGTYFENIVVLQALTLASNYVFSQDSIAINQTIIDGNANGSVIKILNVDNSMVEIIGLTITGGNGTFTDPHGFGQDFLFGGGIFIENCAMVEINFNKIVGNILSTDHNSAGGIYAYNSNISVFGCNISENEIQGGSFLGEGGGIFMYNSTGGITNTKITNNIGGLVYGQGGGIYARNASLIVSDSEIINNECIEGAGIYCFNVELDIENVRVNDNEGQFSAGLYIYNPEPTECSVNNVDFHSNLSHNSGGAVTMAFVNAVINDISVNDNNGGHNNGGINFTRSNVQMNHSEVRRNVSEAGIGGEASGILLYQTDLYLFDVIIDSNECLYSSHFNEGGGISMSSSNLYMDSVIITNNIADQGGAIRSSMSTVTMSRSLIAKNKSLYEGGAIYSYDTDFTIINSTIVDNYAGSAAIYSRENRFLFLNTILWNPNETELYYHVPYNEESYAEFAFSNVRGMEDNIITNNYGSVTWYEGNINEDPLFTDPENYDYTLQTSSLLIDAGTAFFELDGNVFIDYEEEEYNGIAPDIGAFESDSFTSISKFLNEGNLLVYPNPFKNILNINFQDDIENTYIQIYNFKGQLIRNLLLSNKSQNIDLSELERGIYFLKIYTGNSVLNKEIIKL